MKLLRQLAWFVRRLAGELSDQDAYQRHLTHAGHPHTPKEWRTFIDQRHRRKYQNAKCC